MRREIGALAVTRAVRDGAYQTGGPGRPLTHAHDWLSQKLGVPAWKVQYWLVPNDHAVRGIEWGELRRLLDLVDPGGTAISRLQLEMPYRGSRALAQLVDPLYLWQLARESKELNVSDALTEVRERAREMDGLLRSDEAKHLDRDEYARLRVETDRWLSHVALPLGEVRTPAELSRHLAWAKNAAAYAEAANERGVAFFIREAALVMAFNLNGTLDPQLRTAQERTAVAALGSYAPVELNRLAARGARDRRVPLDERIRRLMSTYERAEQLHDHFGQLTMAMTIAAVEAGRGKEQSAERWAAHACALAGETTQLMQVRLAVTTLTVQAAVEGKVDRKLLAHARKQARQAGYGDQDAKLAQFQNPELTREDWRRLAGDGGPKRTSRPKSREIEQSHPRS